MTEIRPDSAVPISATHPQVRSDPGKTEDRTIRFDPRNVWRVGFVVIALAAVALLLRFVIADGGNVIFTVLMAWFASIAMEPAVARLSRHMRRGAATGLVMPAAVVFGILFMLAFGKLFIDQVAQLLEGLPRIADSVVAAINKRTDSNYQVEDILTQLNITPSQVAGYAAQVVGGVLGLLGSVVGSFFTLFTFGLFTFYLSADGPRFRLYIATLFPSRFQQSAVQVWDITAQFVPTIGTYIAIVLPVLVGLLSPNPWIGLIALAWALLYQQVENLTFEPRISARAVNLHPAVAFAVVMLGAALFGVAGALLAIPVGAMLIALVEARNMRHGLSPELATEASGSP
ncbi:MAG TPA: AI-2E family transporter [Actinomycetota bacterium]|nr:AI-2E family transporter [Actinomycetota bacterium]